MRLTLKFTLLVLLFSYGTSSGQWLRKSESSEELYKEAKRESDLKHYQRAIDLCLRAVDITPNNLDIHLLMGKNYGLAGKTDSAIIELEYVIEKDPKYKDAHLALINLEIVACNYVEAMEFTEKALKIFPEDRDFLLKKLFIYEKQEDWTNSNRMAEYLFERFPADPYIRTVYLDFKLMLAREYAHRGYIEVAKRAYEAVLEQDPMNPEALEAIYALNVRSGNYENSLSYTNRALQVSPNSYEFLKKKIAILEAMSRYPEAIEVSQKLLRLYPASQEAQRLNTYLREEASRYYTKTDPYMEYQAIVDREPGNHFALTNLINIAYGRGLYNDALMWVNKALKQYPNDNEFLLKKIGILEDERKYHEASTLAEIIYNNNPTADNKQNFIELRNLSAKQFINDQEFDSATVAIKSVLYYEPANLLAVNYLANAYVQTKQYDSAVQVIDDALVYFPDDQSLLFKKAGVLEAGRRYDEAAVISRDLLQRYPDNNRYLMAFVEQSLAASRESMQYEDYTNTIATLKEVLDDQPDNIDALNYMINIESASKNYPDAIYYCDQALGFYPDNKDFLLKKASVYAEAKMFRDAYTISGSLYSAYPFSTRYRNAYVEHLMGSGKEYSKNGNPDSALIEYAKVLAVMPDDTLPLYFIVNILLDKKQYDSALVYIAHGREVYPSNPYFLIKRSQIYEAQQKWKEAWLSYDTLLTIVPYDPKLVDYSEYLYSKTLKNEVGFFYLHSQFNDSSHSYAYNLATFQYSHFFNKLTLTGRLDFAGRTNIAGFQYEAEIYYAFARKWTLYAGGSYSPVDSLFPSWKGAISLFHNFNNGWEGELGGRYLQTISGTAYPGVASIGRDAKEWYFNLKGFVIPLVQPGNLYNTYYAGVLTTRFYLNKYADYISGIGGYGTSPDDFSRNYQLPHLLNYNTVNCGLGYSKHFHYRTTLGIFGTWYNEYITSSPTKEYVNQFDIYLTVLRKL